LLEADYFDVNRAQGRFGVVDEVSFGGTHALRNQYAAGVEDAGGLKFSFGATPVYPKRFTDQNFQEIYWRFYMRTGAGWVGQPMKVTRATIFTSSNWSQAAIGHLWQDNALGMELDPATGVSGSTVVTTGWNDFDHLKWLGESPGKTQVYAEANREKWFCVEVHMRLNTPGASDGVFEFWIDDQLQARQAALNWRGGYTQYGLNALTLEGWINNGAPQPQARYFDNLVVSKSKIGCSAGGVQPQPPTDLRVSP
jgi:hypothetical protein